MRLTNDPATSFTGYNNARTITSNGSSVHIAWKDNRIADDWEIFYKRSTDNGTTWSVDTRLTNSVGASYNPSITASGQTIHVVWYDNRDGYKKIYYKRSSDNGITWGTDTRLTEHMASSEEPSITVSGENVHVTWFDTRDGNSEIYYKRSTDGGISWGSDTRLTNSIGNSYGPAVSLSGQTIHIVWYDNRTGIYKTYYKRSTNNGTNWEADVLLATSSEGGEPCIAVSNQNVHVVWEDYRHSGVSEIYYKNSTDFGVTWGSDIRMTNSPGISEDPSIAATGENVHIVWYDKRTGNNEIYYKQSTNEGSDWTIDDRLTNNTGNRECAFVSVSGTYVHLAWYDFRDGNAEIYYKRNPTGNLTGISTINSEIPNSYALSQNYPNPFNPSTKIQFAVPKQSKISLKILDVTGRIAASVIENLQMNPGNYEESFESKNLASGVYFYSLYADGIVIETKKMVLLK